MDRRGAGPARSFAYVKHTSQTYRMQPRRAVASARGYAPPTGRVGRSPIMLASRPCTLGSGSRKDPGRGCVGQRTARPDLRACGGTTPGSWLDVVTNRFWCPCDCRPFYQAGIPTPGFIQDPLEYDTRTHHTNSERMNAWSLKICDRPPSRGDDALQHGDARRPLTPTNSQLMRAA